MTKMPSSSKKWTRILTSMEVAPCMVIDEKDKRTVSSTMTMLLTKGNQEFVLKQSKLSSEVIVVRIK